MKKSKRIFTALICAALLCAIPMQTLAAETTLGDKAGEVYGVYNAGDKPTSHSVDIAWGGMEFSYDANEQWDDTSHEWVATAPRWVVLNNTNTITIANNSSVEVSAVFSFAAEGDYNTVTGGTFSSGSSAFTANTLSMDVAATGIGTATEHVVSFMPEGTLAASVSSRAKIGTITITLS